jgi:hypothetical protein
MADALLYNKVRTLLICLARIHLPAVIQTLITLILNSDEINNFGAKYIADALQCNKVRLVLYSSPL